MQKLVISFILTCFLANTFGPLPAHAQDFILPAPGTMVALSQNFNPPMLKGIKVHTDDPFKFDFILDQGDIKQPVETPFIASQNQQQPSQEKSNVETQHAASLQEQSTTLIKYFLAALTIPEQDLWVNLSPYEKDRIIPNSFGLTEMGRDLLAEDYMLKQITASLIYPEDEIGKKFWKRIYEEAQKKFGTTNIPVNTFNKVWIVPEKAVVYENAKAGTAYVVESKLKVMLEEDYVAITKQPQSVETPFMASQNNQQTSQKQPNVQTPLMASLQEQQNIGNQIIREIVIPALTKEINEGKNFSKLRQVYSSLILAAWYKKKIKDSILSQVYADKNKVVGVGYEKELSSPNALVGDPEHIYQQYLKAFKKGVYNYIKEDVNPITQEIIPRKYFSGGFNLAMTSKNFGESKEILKVVNDFTLPNQEVRNRIYHAEVNVKPFGQMKKPSVRPFEDSVLKESPEQVIKSVSIENKAKIAPTVKYVPLTNSDGTLNMDLGGYYSRGGLGEWQIVINTHLDEKIQEEALFHEQTEIELLINNLNMTEHQAHIIASALQRLKFSKDGELTDFDAHSLKYMSKEDIAKLFIEKADGRKAHIKFIEDYFNKNFSVEVSKSNIKRVMEYENSFIDTITHKVFTQFEKGKFLSIQIDLENKSTPFDVLPKHQILNPWAQLEFSPDGNLQPVTYTLFGNETLPEPNSEAADMFDQLEAFEQAESKVVGLLNMDEITAGDIRTLLSALRHMVVVYLKLFKNFPAPTHGTPWSEEQIIKEAADDSGDLQGGKNIARAYQHMEASLNQKVNHLPAGQILPDAIRANIRELDDQKAAKLIGVGAENYDVETLQSITFHELINIVHQKGLQRNLDGMFEQIKGKKSAVYVEVEGVDIINPSHGAPAFSELIKIYSSYKSTMFNYVGPESNLTNEGPTLDWFKVQQKFTDLLPIMLLRAKEGDPDAILALGDGFKKDSMYELPIAEAFLEDLKDKAKDTTAPYFEAVMRSLGKIIYQTSSNNPHEGQVIYKILRAHIQEGNEFVKRKAFLGLLESKWFPFEYEYKEDMGIYKQQLIASAKSAPEYFEALMSLTGRVFGKDQEKLEEIFQWYMQHPYLGMGKAISLYANGGGHNKKKINDVVQKSNSITPEDKIFVDWMALEQGEDTVDNEKLILSHLEPSGDVAPDYWKSVLPAVAGVWHRFSNTQVRQKILDHIFKHIDAHTPGSLEALVHIYPHREKIKQTDSGSADLAMAMTAGKESSSAALNHKGFKLSYVDARRNPTSPTPLAMRYIAQAFSVGQGFSKNYLLFPPSAARIVIGDSLSWISMGLGAHSATVRFNLKPLQDGGGISVNYKDSGLKYAPGSNMRLHALAEAFRQEGFRVDIKENTFQAFLDKNNGVNFIDDLPTVLHFVIQALSSTLDMDLRIKNGELRRDDIQGQEEIQTHLANVMHNQGYWNRGGEKTKAVTKESIKMTLSKEVQEKIKADAFSLGIALPEGEIHLRHLQEIERQKNLLHSRGALVETLTSVSLTPEYVKSQSASPTDYFLGELFASEKTMPVDAKPMAIVAHMAKAYADEVKIIGAVGKYQIQQITVSTLEDRVTFLLLQDSQTQEPVFAVALLGDFFHNQPRFDNLRQKKLSNNVLTLTDVKEIFTLNSITTSGTFRQWLKNKRVHLLSGHETPDNVFDLLGLIKQDDHLASPLDWTSFDRPPVNMLSISPVSVSGKPIYPDAVIGQAMFKNRTRASSEFKNNILFADVTDIEDEPFIEEAGGVVVTQGGPQAHAAIRSKELKKAGIILNHVAYEEGRIVFKAFKGDVRQHTKQFAKKSVIVQEYSDYELKDTVIEEGDLVYLDSRSGDVYVLAKKGNLEAIDVWRQYQQWSNQPRVETLLMILGSCNEDSLTKAILNDILIHSRLSTEQIESLLSVLSQTPQKKQAIIPFLTQQTQIALKNFTKARTRLEQQLRTPYHIEQLILDVDHFGEEVEHIKKLLSLMNGSWGDSQTLPQIKEIEATLIAQAKVQFASYRQNLQMEVKAFESKLDDLTLKNVVDLNNRLRTADLSLELMSPKIAEKFEELLLQRQSAIEVKFKDRLIIWKDELSDVIEGTMGLGDFTGFVRDLVGGKSAQSSEITYALARLKDIGFIPQGLDVINPLGLTITPSSYQKWSQLGQMDESLVKILSQSYQQLVTRQIDSVKEFIEQDQRTSEKIKAEVLEILGRNIDDIEKLRNDLDAFVSSLPVDAGISKSLKNRLEVIGMVAARSSGLKEDNLKSAGAGKFKTVLGVVGISQLKKAVIAVWQSGAEGVLVEEMINSKQALLIFSVDDHDKNMRRIKMDVGDGLAQGLVAQIIKDADSYVVQKNSNGVPEIIETLTHIGAKQEVVMLNKMGGITTRHREAVLIPALKEAQIVMTSQIIQLLEMYFGLRLDIEASFDTDNRLVILQARPITTLIPAFQRGLKILKDSAMAQVYKDESLFMVDEQVRKAIHDYGYITKVKVYSQEERETLVYPDGLPDDVNTVKFAASGFEVQLQLKDGNFHTVFFVPYFSELNDVRQTSTGYKSGALIFVDQKRFGLTSKECDIEFGHMGFIEDMKRQPRDLNDSIEMFAHQENISSAGLRYFLSSPAVQAFINEFYASITTSPNSINQGFSPLFLGAANKLNELWSKEMLDLKRVERPLSGIRLHDWFSQVVKIIVNEKRTAAAKSKSARTGLSVADSAMKGGIDLTPANMNLETKNTGGAIKFKIDPAMLEQLKNAPGFVPVVINIQPLKDLNVFLGLNN